MDSAVVGSWVNFGHIFILWIQYTIQTVYIYIHTQYILNTYNERFERVYFMFFIFILYLKLIEVFWFFELVELVFSQVENLFLF